MNNMSKVVAFLIIQFVFSNSYAQGTQQGGECVAITVGFFNGVGNSLDEAVMNAAALRAKMSASQGPGARTFVVFYNRTQYPPVDVLETFIQRANQLDNSGSLASRYEFYWDAIRSSSDSVLWRVLIGLVEDAAETLRAIQEFYVTVLSDSLLIAVEQALSEDYKKHEAQLDEIMASGQPVLLVAHSQGNLFAAQAHKYLQDQGYAEAFKTVHVAPPTIDLPGPFVLSKGDRVIDALRILNPALVHDGNVEPAASEGFFDAGHGFITTYLETPPYSELNRLLESAVTEFVNRSGGCTCTYRREEFPSPENPLTIVRTYECGVVYPFSFPVLAHAYTERMETDAGGSTFEVLRCNPAPDRLKPFDTLSCEYVKGQMGDDRFGTPGVPFSGRKIRHEAWFIELAGVYGYVPLEEVEMAPDAENGPKKI